MNVAGGSFLSAFPQRSDLSDVSEAAEPNLTIVFSLPYKYTKIFPTV